jgi:two-component system response regulator
VLLNEMIKILIIDDDPDCRLLVRDSIEGARIINEIFEAGTGEQGLEFLNDCYGSTASPLPGLIYLDINMPGIDGLQVLKRIRSDARFQHIPVVMMTSMDDDREKNMAAEYGANSYTLKPSRPEHFINTVVTATEYWLGVHRYPEARRTGI